MKNLFVDSSFKKIYVPSCLEFFAWGTLAVTDALFASLVHSDYLVSLAVTVNNLLIGSIICRYVGDYFAAQALISRNDTKAKDSYRRVFISCAIIGILSFILTFLFTPILLHYLLANSHQVSNGATLFSKFLSLSALTSGMIAAARSIAAAKSESSVILRMSLITIALNLILNGVSYLLLFEHHQTAFVLSVAASTVVAQTIGLLPVLKLHWRDGYLRLSHKCLVRRDLRLIASGLYIGLVSGIEAITNRLLVSVFFFALASVNQNYLVVWTAIQPSFLFVTGLSVSWIPVVNQKLALETRIKLQVDLGKVSFEIFRQAVVPVIFSGILLSSIWIMLTPHFTHLKIEVKEAGVVMLTLITIETFGCLNLIALTALRLARKVVAPTIFAVLLNVFTATVLFGLTYLAANLSLSIESLTILVLFVFTLDQVVRAVLNACWSMGTNM